MTWCLRQARSLYCLILLALFGILDSTSETTDREQGLGAIDCPRSLTVHWNKNLARPPYVENCSGDFDGLFPSNVFWIFHAFPITAPFSLSTLSFFSSLFMNVYLKGLFGVTFNVFTIT